MAGLNVVSGSCFCAAIRFTIALPTRYCVHCHCSMCRRAHGAGYVTWVVLPRDQLRLEKGEEELVEFASSDHGRRRFCRRCGSSLFCDNAGHPDVVDVVLANIDGEIDRGPQMHVFWDSGADWAQAALSADDGLPRLGGPSGRERLDP